MGGLYCCGARISDQIEADGTTMMSIALSVLFLVASVMNGVLSFHAWQRGAVAARWFAALMAAIAFWSLAAGGEALSTSLGGKILWSQISYVGVASVPLLWFLFAAAYTQRF